MLSSIAKSWSSGSAEAYTVHEMPNPASDRIDRAEALVFVRDGFSWGALLLGPLWLLIKAKWVALAAYAVSAALIVLLLWLFGTEQQGMSIALFALNAFLAFEMPSLERLALERDGWQEIGTVSGRDQSECERRFFETWLPAQPTIASRASDQSGRLVSTAGTMTGESAANGWRRLFSRGA